jgi:hypothetical protein
LPSPAPSATRRPSSTWRARRPRARPAKARCAPFKRHLARRFHKLLSEPPADQQPATDGKPIIEPQLAAIVGKLPEMPARRHPRAPADPNIKGEAPLPMVCIG